MSFAVKIVLCGDAVNAANCDLDVSPNTDLIQNGEDAVAFLREGSVDLILLDMIMEPGMDGLETYQSVLKIRPNQKVIIVSGYSATDRIKKAMELGVRRYVKKPYGLEELVTKIHKVLAD